MCQVGTKSCAHARVLAKSTAPHLTNHRAAPPNYDYDPGSSSGPDAWGALAIDCLGCNQSPINIEPCKACRIEPCATDALKLFRWDEVPAQVVLLNAGTTIKIYFEYKLDGVPTLCGGPLNDIYELSHMHFHWASNSFEGSEHYLDGKSSSAEAHAVFVNQKYGTLENAVKQKDGLAVVGRLYNFVCNQKHYLPFITKLKRITKFNETYTFKDPHTFTLSCIMGSVGFEYYVYEGSLTTPPCSEAVTWIVIMKTKKISIADLEEFRKLRNSKNQWMTPNFRRIQSLNGRSLFHYSR